MSGKNAIHIVGAAVVSVDNSILVGQSAVMSSRGAGLVIAKNSVFHGRRDVDGAFVLIDLGGNTFEEGCTARPARGMSRGYPCLE